MVLNYSITFQVLQQFVQAHNTLQDSTSTMVRQAMCSTAKEILRIYGVTLIKAQKIAPLRPDKLPSMRTNNQQLATITGASGRTIQRHIKRLLDAGVLLKKVWHGTNSSYELWINPKILWISGYGHVDNYNNRKKTQNKESIDNQYFNSEEKTKCPHSYTYKKTLKNNNILIAVDKLKSQWQDQPCHEPTVACKKNKKERNSLSLIDNNENEDKTKKKTGNTQGKKVLQASPKKQHAKKIEKNAPEGAAQKNTQSCETTRGEKVWRSDARMATQNVQSSKEPKATSEALLPSWQTKAALRQTLLLSYANQLWEQALEVLYDPKVLTKRQIAIGKTLLFKWYEPVQDAKLEQVHKVYLARLELVRKYLEKDPENRFVQLPYRYFDPENPHGFAGTMSWYKADKAYKKQRDLQQILRQEIQKFKRNEQLDTAQARPRLTLFRECEQRISKLEIPSLLQQFYKAIAQPKTL